MHDQLSDQRSYSLLNIIDDCNREGLVMDADISLPSQRVIRSLEQSTAWVMPWHGHKASCPKNVVTAKDYSGINVLSLWSAACGKGYTSNLWGTYKQWQSLGAQVRKGEKAHLIVLDKTFEKEGIDEETGEQEIVKGFVLKSSSVFNANQVDGFKIPEPETSQTITQLDSVEDFIKKTGARILYRDSFARYQPINDLVTMPDKDCFVSTEISTAIETYYGTILHELAHWTGHHTRLDRIARFGNESYAIEELIAELTAAFLCAEFRVSSSPRQDHVNYIASWLKVLKNDNKAIFYAACQAALATEYLKAQQVKVGN